MLARLATLLFGLMVLGGCAGDPIAPTMEHEVGLLSSRPHDPTGAVLDPGLHTIDLGLEGDRLDRGVEPNPRVYVPAGYDPSDPAPLLVLFHGAGGTTQTWAWTYEHADRVGAVLLLIQSQGGTWDLMLDGWGRDVAAVDMAVDRVFDRVAIDPGAVAFGGFSDGASYSLSLGLNNPDLVRQIIAFSPGFEMGFRKTPRARIFITHGTEDTILLVSRTRAMVMALRDSGYPVSYTEFAGGHGILTELAEGAFDWLVEPGA